MLRCDRPAGRFRVEFQYLDALGVPLEEEYIADIGQHAAVYAEDGRLLEDAPRVSQKRPYTGELCECEIEWLRHIPGKVYSHHRRYTVKTEELWRRLFGGSEG